VLKKQERICDSAGFARSNNLSLETQAFRVTNSTEMQEVEMHEEEGAVYAL
jgi:hypothetical protein